MDSLWERLLNGGVVMPWLLGLAVLGLAFAAERWLLWLAWIYYDRGLHHCNNIADCTRAIKSMRWKAPLGQFLSLALAQKPLNDDNLQLLLIDFEARIATRISSLGWLGGLLPMLGLLGTVTGMISTFSELSNPSFELSQGIAEALYTTQVGLIGAIPLLISQHMLQRLQKRWQSSADRLYLLLTKDHSPTNEHATKI